MLNQILSCVIAVLGAVLASCANTPPAAPAEKAPRDVEVFKSDLLGTTSMRVSSLPSFDDLPEQNKRVVVECQFQSFVGGAQGDLKSRHETYSDFGRRECFKWASTGAADVGNPHTL